MPYPHRPRSAYLHIPFCHRRCYYCDFAVVPLGDQAQAEDGPGSASIRDYLELLLREIDSAPAGPPLSTVYFGGGTPSLLTANQIGSLLAALRDHYGLQQGAEITLEMDPASFDQRKLQDLIGHGINRVSLGGQSFDDAVLLDLGRRHRSSDLREACLWMQDAHRSGSLRSWSLDLIQNLPGQTPDHWLDQLEQAIATGAPHLSVYDLSVEPGTVFERRQRRGDLALPPEALAVDLMALTGRQLAAAGLSRYEISNYARPGHASRHNRVYWSGAGWWGFGMGATSGAFGERLPRPRTREGYRAWLVEQTAVPNPTPDHWPPIPIDDQLLVGLRRREGVALEPIGCPEPQTLIERWRQLIAAGLVAQRAGRWQLTDPEGMALSNQVLVEVLLWWEDCSDLAPTDPVPS